MAIRADDVDLDRDRTLVQRFQAGDDAAFGELYRRYHDRLERFCLKRVGDQHAAEEVAQEAFTRALAALQSLEGDRRFYPWVSVIASRLCIDHHRRQARTEATSDPDPGPVTGGQEEIVDSVDKTLAVAALARLAPRHQDVLQLREVEGWSYQRIAEHYGVRVGTIETLLFRARRALRREFHVVDGAGLAAIPLLGRLIGLAARFRDRIGEIPSVGGATSAVAAAATATVAAVALVIVPGSAPATTTPPPPPVAAAAPVYPTGEALPYLHAGSALAPSGAPSPSDHNAAVPSGTRLDATAPATTNTTGATTTTTVATESPAPATPTGVLSTPAPVAGVTTTTVASGAPVISLGPTVQMAIPGTVGGQPLTITVPVVPGATEAVGGTLKSLGGVVGGLLGS